MVHESSLPLSDEIQQRVFGFVPQLAPELVVASSMQGNLSELPRSPLSEQPTIDELRSFIPPYGRVMKAGSSIMQSIISGMYAHWQEKDYDAALQHGNQTANMVEGFGVVSPLTFSEQGNVILAVRDYIHRSDPLRKLSNQLDPDSPDILSSLQLRTLSVVSDLAAMPRLAAGIEYFREREAVIATLERDYIIEDGRVTGFKGPGGVGYVPLQLLGNIQWRKPCFDMVPTRHERQGYIDTRYTRRTLNQFMRILAVAVEIDPTYLHKPPEAFSSDDLRSPFRVNTPTTVERALYHYNGDKRTILDMFFTGQKIELPNLGAIPVRDKKLVDVVQLTRTNHEPDQGLQKQHEKGLSMLQEQEAGRQLIDLATADEGGLIELTRADWLDSEQKKQASLKVNGRLRLLARILYSLMDGFEDSIPPRISLRESPEEIISSIVGDYGGRLRAVHICKEPNGQGPAAKVSGIGAAKTMQVAVLVEKLSTGHKTPEFAGAYFIIKVAGAPSEGARDVKIYRSSTAFGSAKAKRLATSLSEQGSTPESSEVV